MGQARPTLHATLMQRMTDVLSRMLNDPNSRASAQRSTSESESSQNQLIPDAATDEDGNNTEGGGGGNDSGGGGQSQSSAVFGVCLASSSSQPTETPDTVANECRETDQLPTSSQATTTNDSEELESETNCDGLEVNTTMQPDQTSTVCQPESSEPPQESGSTSGANSVTEETEDVSPIVEGMNHENEEAPARTSSNIEGLQDRITSLTRGFVEK